MSTVLAVAAKFIYIVLIVAVIGGVIGAVVAVAMRKSKSGPKE
ncbi:MAG: hypothetical protein ACYTF6_14195 [Planctomycetota bacterium]|jgi:hypothetical protein